MSKYKLNHKFNDVEIYFDSEPSTEILKNLHINKWRWHRYKRCWYNKQTEENINFAKSICNNNNTGEIVETVNNSKIIENIHGVKVGDIYYTSWDYDMTIKFFQVVKITAKRATIKEIHYILAYDCSTGYSVKIVPIKDSFVNNEIITTGTDKLYDGKSTILKNCNGHIGYKFDGKAVYFNSLN